MNHEKEIPFNIEPKFKVGDFILNGDVTNKGEYEIFKILKVCSRWYDVENIYDGRLTMITFAQEDTCRLWTIDDAKPGDMLATEPIDSYPFPFVAIYKNRGLDFFNSYCFIGFNGKFYNGETGHSIEDIYPATKEQRDTLFAKMKENDYEWDAENEELKKIIDKKQINKNLQDNSFHRMFEWKPSEEQINAFEHFVRSIGESGYASPYENNIKLLYSLLNDLKKLKGE